VTAPDTTRYLIVIEGAEATSYSAYSPDVPGCRGG
jgi:predicted RNase H-like HicB family nuclease